MKFEQFEEELTKMGITFDVLKIAVLTWKKYPLATTILMKCSIDKCNEMSLKSYLWLTVAQIRTAKNHNLAAAGGHFVEILSRESTRLYYARTRLCYGVT